MTAAGQSRMGVSVLGLAGIMALTGCAPAGSGPDADALGRCYRSIQIARIAVQVSGVDLSSYDRKQALDALKRANEDIILAWADREGVSLSREDLQAETPTATGFINGIDAEAGLSGQAMMNELSAAGDAPENWRAKFDAASECAEDLAR